MGHPCQSDTSVEYQHTLNVLTIFITSIYSVFRLHHPSCRQCWVKSVWMVAAGDRLSGFFLPPDAPHGLSPEEETFGDIKGSILPMATPAWAYTQHIPRSKGFQLNL